MQLLRHASAFSALMALATRSAPVLACGGGVSPYYVVADQLPTGNDVALNAPLVVQLREIADGPVVSALDPRLTLTQRGSDQVTPLKQVGTAPTTLSWVPLQPLEPQTEYDAHFNPGYEGIPDTIWHFTSGTLLAAPLSLEGKLEVTLEPGTQDVFECVNSCNSSCVAKGQIPVTKARVKLPRARGGFEQRVGTIYLTDDLPYDFSVPSKTAAEPYHGSNVSLLASASLDDPNTLDVVITVPEQAAPYRPCFSLQAVDARGDTVSAEPLCLLETFPPTPSDQTLSDETTAGGAPAAEDTPAEASGERTSSGCSYQPTRTPTRAWLLALGALAVIARRRSKSAP